MTALHAAIQADDHLVIGSVDAARSEERRRIGDGLHDEVAQLLYAARLSLETSLGRPGIDPACAAAISKSCDLLVRAGDAIRVVIHELAPPDTSRMDVRLRAMAARVADEFQLPVQVELDDAAVDRANELSADLRDGLVRVAREALTNSAKHAGPCRAVLTLTRSDDDRIMLTIADDGRPRAAARKGRVAPPARGPQGGHGLAALRRLMLAHGATLSVSRDVRGTTVSVVARRPASLPGASTLASAGRNQDA